MLGGTLYGSQIEIDGKMTSGEVHTCGRVTPRAFEKGRRGGPVICLHNVLTCENYGRFRDVEMSGKRLNVDQLAAQIADLERLHSFDCRMANDCFRTAVFFFLGGVESATGAMNLQGLQTKSANLQLIVVIAKGVSKYFTPIFDGGAKRDTNKMSAIVKESLDSLAFTESEVKVLPSEFGAVHIRFLLDRCAELSKMYWISCIATLGGFPAYWKKACRRKRLANCNRIGNGRNRPLSGCFNARPNGTLRVCSRALKTQSRLRVTTSSCTSPSWPTSSSSMAI